MRSFPPLSAIRAFEAAARLGSFTMAAAELGMSQAAISYQIKRLETELATALFIRRNRRVELTPEGARIAKVMTKAFDMMAAGLSLRQERSILSVTTTSSFANLWLAPRLGDFQSHYPMIDVRLTGSNELHDLESGEYDLAIRLGRGSWGSVAAERLFDVAFMPMCSPSFLAAHKELNDPSSLSQVLRISPQDPWWGLWFKDAGLTPERTVGRGIRLGNQSECTAAARAGQGLAILTQLFSAPDIASGTLVCPFDLLSVDGSAYWLVYEQARRADTRIVAFRRWLAEALDNAWQAIACQSRPTRPATAA